MADDAEPAGGSGVTVRQARPEDHEPIAAFTEDTWEDGDYVASVFPEWVEGDGPTQRTLVAELADPEDSGESAVVGVVSFVLLSETEAWGQGLRVHPDHRGRGISTAMTYAGFDWAREQGATVARNMVFSGNEAGLGQSRRVGYRPTTEFRYVHPEPGGPPGRGNERTDLEVSGDPDLAWTYWTNSTARDHLRGLGMTTEESWALAELTRADLRRIADERAVFAVGSDDGVRGTSYRTRTFERGGDDPTTWAEYGVGAWADLEAARALLSAIAGDAAGLGADRTRVLVPETTRYVSDAAALRVEVADEPDFVLTADLTGDYRSGE